MQIGMHRFEDAARYAGQGVEISRTISVPGARTQAFCILASARKYLGDFPGALEAIREARKQEESYRHGNDYWPLYGREILAMVRWHEGLLLGEDGGVDLNRPLEAAELFQEAFKALEESAKNEPKDYQDRIALAEPGLYLGNVLRHSNPARALEVYDNALIRIREVPNDIMARRKEACVLASSSYAARRIHHEKDAKARIDAAFRLLRETKDYPTEKIKPGGEADTAVRALADDYAETGQHDRAIEVYEELRRKVMISNADEQNDLLNAVYLSRLDASLASLLRRAGRTEEAIALEGNRLNLWRHWGSKLPNNPFVQRQLAAGKSAV